MAAKRPKTPNGNFFERLSSKVTKLSGTSTAFLLAMSIVVIWLISGPIFDFSNTWQLVINTGTTIVTFLMVFLIQRSQNKESLAIQLKLNELIASGETASNRLIDVESLSENELLTLQKFYIQLVEMSKKDKTLHQSHSIDDAIDLHERKAMRIKKVGRSNTK